MTPNSRSLLMVSMPTISIVILTSSMVTLDPGGVKYFDLL